jgi:bifunctional enzyme CysN/CysC
MNRMSSATLSTSPSELRPANSSILRFVTCGSVDDGKSTLIGRLLYDAKGIFEDQLTSIETASTKYSTTGGLDLALLTDGLKAEREQGITIDVAYRYFATPTRKFIIADSPGHEQYTRNMATGASTADLAILLIDARYGVVTQTRRHAFIVSLLGIRHVVLAVNKMDLAVGELGAWSRSRFEQICDDFEAVRRRVGLANVVAIPMSALLGENVTARTGLTPWYGGPTLLEHLERVDVDAPPRTTFRMPVQWVCRPDLNFRGYAGTIAGGSVSAGDRVRVLPGGLDAVVKQTRDADGVVDRLHDGQAGMITLDREVDASRGDTIAALDAPPTVARKVLADVVWFSPEPMTIGKGYRIKHTTRQLNAAISAIRHRVDINTLDQLRADVLSMNDIAVCEIECAGPLVFDAYADNRSSGAFILIDRQSNNTVAAGMIRQAIEGDELAGVVTPMERSLRLNQQPTLVELSGEGASRCAEMLDRLLFDAGHLAVVVSGDESPTALLRAGLIVIRLGEPGGTSVDPFQKHHVDVDADAIATARQIKSSLVQAGRLEAASPRDAYSI